MKVSLDHFENKYGIIAGKRLLFVINSVVFYAVMLIAVNKLGINPLKSFSTLSQAFSTILGIRTFEDIVSDSTLGILDATVSSVTMYNTIFSLFIIIIPIMVIIQSINIVIRVVKVNKAGKYTREPEFYFVCENNKQITRHFGMMFVFFCITICLFLPFFTEPNHIFSSDNSLGIAEFLTISAVKSSNEAGSLYTFQNTMILSMVFSMLSVAFLYMLSSCITVLLCSITSSLESTLGREARQILLLCFALPIVGKYVCEFVTKPFLDTPVVLQFNLYSYILLGLSAVGFITMLLPLGRKIDTEK